MNKNVMWNNLGSILTVSCLSLCCEAGAVRQTGGNLQAGGGYRGCVVLVPTWGSEERQLRTAPRALYI